MPHPTCWDGCINVSNFWKLNIKILQSWFRNMSRARSNLILWYFKMLIYLTDKSYYFILFLPKNYEDLFVAERRENWAIMTFGTFESQCRITVPRNPLVLQGTPHFWTIHSKWSLFKWKESAEQENFAIYLWLYHTMPLMYIV